MAQPTAAKYVSDEVEPAGDRSLRVCTDAGRKCVRNIQQYPILSVEWLALVDSLKQLLRLVQLEGRMPANSRVADVAGRNAESEGTLWDQEVSESAIRILVEEAKVNLCLRVMNEYKQWQYNASEMQSTKALAMQQHDLSESHIER